MVCLYSIQQSRIDLKFIVLCSMGVFNIAFKKFVVFSYVVAYFFIFL